MRPWAALFVPGDLGPRELDILIEALTGLDVCYLQGHPETPDLYSSGVRFREEDGREEWLAVPWILERWRERREGSDCEDLAAWRAAELRVRYGEHSARCVWVAYRSPDKLVYHIRVRRADGSLEDPSALLGMTTQPGGPQWHLSPPTW